MRTRHALLVLAVLVPLLPFACAPEDVVLFTAPARQVTGGSGGIPGKGGGSGRPATGGEGAVSKGGSAGLSGGASSGTAGAGGRAGSFGGGSSGDSGRGGEGGFREVLFCRTDLDCQSSWWCQKQDCFSSLGACTPPQVFCNEPPQPVCGCDGITYWNDCVRREAATTAATPGECRVEARPCRSAEDCGTENAECAFLYPRPDRCDEPPSGTCWVVPRDCPRDDSIRGGARWIECLEELPPDAPLPPDFPKCVDTCTAIQSGRAHVRPLRDVDCPE